MTLNNAVQLWKTSTKMAIGFGQKEVRSVPDPAVRAEQSVNNPSKINKR